MNADKCFYPDGISNGATTNPQFVPCDPSAAVSACCAVGESCVGNGLCYSNTGGIYRGACTDPSWKSSVCPHVCTADDNGSNAGSQNGFHFLINCGTASTGYAWGCSTDACSDSAKTHIFAAGGIEQTNITGSTNTSSAAPSPSKTIITAPSSTQNISSATTSCLSPTSASNVFVAIGAGVGVPLGVLLIAAVGTALFYRKKWLSTKRDMAPYHHVDATSSPPVEHHATTFDAYKQETQYPSELGSKEPAELGGGERH